MVSSGLIDRPAALGDELIGVLQELPRGGHVGVEQAVRPERRVVRMACIQQACDGLEEAAVLHPEGDLVEVQRADVLAVEERQHVVVRAVLRDVVPRLGVELRRLLDHVERDRLCRDDELLVLRHVDREVGELAGLREVEEVVDRLGVVRLQVEWDAAGDWPLATGIAPIGSCSSTVSFCRDEVGLVTTTWQP